MRKLPASLEELAKELPLTLSKEEAASIMRLSIRSFERMVAKGELQVMKLGTATSARVVVTRAEVLRWMAARTEPSLVQP